MFPSICHYKHFLLNFHFLNLLLFFLFFVPYLHNLKIHYYQKLNLDIGLSYWLFESKSYKHLVFFPFQFYLLEVPLLQIMYLNNKCLPFYKPHIQLFFYLYVFPNTLHTTLTNNLYICSFQSQHCTYKENYKTYKTYQYLSFFHMLYT